MYALLELESPYIHIQVGGGSGTASVRCYRRRTGRAYVSLRDTNGCAHTQIHLVDACSASGRPMTNPRVYRG